MAAENGYNFDFIGLVLVVATAFTLRCILNLFFLRSSFRHD